MKKAGKLASKAVTVEDVWESVSQIKGDLNPPPSKTVLTPRSAEACLKHGVNPEILRVRPLESFAAAGMDPTVQRLRHETYTQRRFEMMRIVRSERKRLINQEEREAGLKAGGKKGAARITPEQILAQQAKQNATYVEEEEKRMLKMRKRQEKELEQTLAFEAKMQELQAERDRKMEEERRQMDMAKKEKEKRARERAEDARLREMKKISQAEAEEQRRIAQTRAMFERERQIREERQKAERRAKIEARLKEEERLRKQEEHRLQTARILSEQQAALKRRMLDMELAEKERQALMERKRREERQRLELRRTQMEARIARNMRQAAKVEEHRKELFFEKQSQHEALRAQHLEMQARERALQQHQADLQDQRRQMILDQAKRDEEQHKEQLLDRFENEEENVRRVRDARERELAIAHEKKALRNQMKLENVERIRRINEYKRLQTVRRISQADKRTQDMQDRKQQLIKMRKHNALQIKVQKDKLLAVMEGAKSGGSKATKLLAKHSPSDPTKPRSASLNNKKSKKVQRSQSAQGLLHETQKALGPPPEAPPSRYDSDDAGPSANQLPYISPYETPHAGGKATITL